MDLMDIRRMLLMTGGESKMLGEFSKYQHLEVVPSKISNNAYLRFNHSLGEVPKLLVVKGDNVAQGKLIHLVGHKDIACVAQFYNTNNALQNGAFFIYDTFDGTYKTLSAWFMSNEVIVSSYSSYYWDENVTYSVDVYA